MKREKNFKLTRIFADKQTYSALLPAISSLCKTEISLEIKPPVSTAMHTWKLCCLLQLLKLHFSSSSKAV